MIYTIEDTLEILAGRTIVKTAIHLQSRDRHIIASIAKQVSEKIALTDRQLELVISKFKKYKDALEENDVDVEVVSTLAKTRMPLREIDRTQRIYLESNTIVIKHNNTQHFSTLWKNLVSLLTSPGVYHSTYKRIELNEQNLYEVITILQPEGFEIESGLIDLYNAVYQIIENPIEYAPHMTVENNQYVFKNLSESCNKFINESFPVISDDNLLTCLGTAKQCGIYLKSLEITEKVNQLAASEVTKKVLMHESKKFKADMSTIRLFEIFTAINEMGQWPVIAVVDADTALDDVQNILTSVTGIVDNSEINVFFRLDKEQENSNEFNQMVRDLGLNNYIDDKTKIVVVDKRKLPKPLLASKWNPNTAIFMSTNSYGKVGTYTNRCSSIYYYNTSITYSTAAAKGAKPIVLL
jgi:hypothetical protein